MKKYYFLLIVCLVATLSCDAQSKITTTGNNVINTSDPYAADIVIGSDAGTRHDGSIMWWSSGSASRISNSNDVFYLSVWNTLSPNVGLSANIGGNSFFQGNLGIGTTTPAYKLDVNGDMSGNMLRARGLFSLQQSGKRWDINYESNGNYFFVDEFGIARHITVQGGTGNVGIGTIDPKGYKLAIAGTAIAESMTVKLQGSWPDYVFKHNYQKPTLSQVKAYINESGHLPEMPSEQQVASEGINLGEMNRLLVKKVEELTLYLFEKDRELKKQVQINQNQEQRLRKIEQKLR